MLKVDKLMVFYENALAVNELSIHVDEGEIVGIIGSNSAGKTTLMNTISGLLLDTKLKEQRKGGERITIFGHISFFDQDISNTWADEQGKNGHRALPRETSGFCRKRRGGESKDRLLSFTAEGNERA